MSCSYKLKKSVVIFQRRLTYYRVPLFEAMREELTKHQVDLHVVFGTPNGSDVLRMDTGEMSWGVKLPTWYFSFLKQLLVWHSLPWKLMLSADLVILPHEGSLLANYPVIVMRKILGKKWAFWGHGENLQAMNYSNHKPYAEIVKRFFSHTADWWFAYTSKSVDILTNTGVPAGRIFNLNNAVDSLAILQFAHNISVDEIRARYTELGLYGENIGVFVGSLTQEKRLPFLFAAADIVRSQLNDFELVIVGDGPLRQWVKTEVEVRPWVRWVGIQHGREKVLNLSLGKVMLNPGMVGLAVLDSFAVGIPMITTDCKLHSPEIAYIENGDNGLITCNTVENFSTSVVALMKDDLHLKEVREACLRSSLAYTLSDMSARFTGGILTILEERVTPKFSEMDAPLHIAIIWQRFLPYHVARIKYLREICVAAGYKLTAIEVASLDDSYGFKELANDGTEKLKRYCCFPDSSYHKHAAKVILRGVSAMLMRVNPDIVFAPATPFPEGMAAVQFCTHFGKRIVMMDDAWEHTDRNVDFRLVCWIKRQIHKGIEAVFVPSKSHHAYFEKLGFSAERVIDGVDVVDNDYYFEKANQARANQSELRLKFGLPEKYFLFVGRFLERKGIETLLTAYQKYRSSCAGTPYALVLIGVGDYLDKLKNLSNLFAGVILVGEKHGEALCIYYGLAHCLIVPSDIDPWGLVVNEGMASGLPVIVSRGCGSSSVLVDEGKNGWTFAAKDSEHLAELLAIMGGLSNEEWSMMSAASLAIIAEWSLDRFVQGVFASIRVPKRPSISLLSWMIIRLWKGRVSIN